MAGFKLSMLTPAERKAHRARVKKINSIVKVGNRVMKKALKRNN